MAWSLCRWGPVRWSGPPRWGKAAPFVYGNSEIQSAKGLKFQHLVWSRSQKVSSCPFGQSWTLSWPKSYWWYRTCLKCCQGCRHFSLCLIGQKSKDWYSFGAWLCSTETFQSTQTKSLWKFGVLTYLSASSCGLPGIFLRSRAALAGLRISRSCNFACKANTSYLG